MEGRGQRRVGVCGGEAWGRGWQGGRGRRGMGTEARVGAKNKGKFGFIEQYSGEAEMFVMPGSGGSGGRPGGDDGDGGLGVRGRVCARRGGLLLGAV